MDFIRRGVRPQGLHQVASWGHTQTFANVALRVEEAEVTLRLTADRWGETENGRESGEVHTQRAPSRVERPV